MEEAKYCFDKAYGVQKNISVVTWDMGLYFLNHLIIKKIRDVTYVTHTHIEGSTLLIGRIQNWNPSFNVLRFRTGHAICFIPQLLHGLKDAKQMLSDWYDVLLRKDRHHPNVSGNKGFYAIIYPSLESPSLWSKTCSSASETWLGRDKHHPNVSVDKGFLQSTILLEIPRCCGQKHVLEIGRLDIVVQNIIFN